MIASKSSALYSDTQYTGCLLPTGRKSSKRFYLFHSSYLPFSDGINDPLGPETDKHFINQNISVQ